MHVDALKLVTEVVAGASVLHTLLPPWEVFDDFPTAQKYYKVLIYFVGYVALNGRSTLHPSLSTASGTKLSSAAAGANGGNGGNGPTNGAVKAS